MNVLRVKKLYSVYLIAVLIYMFLPIYANAGGLSGALNKLGVMSSGNKSGVINDQFGGYMTGGSLHTRNQVADERLFNIQLPSLNAGCGGIDLHFGGLGYISGNQLEKLFKDIGSNAGSYATLLTMKTISPQVADVISQLEAMARFLNNQNINSCQAATSIVDGAYSLMTSSQELVCNEKKLGANRSGNYFAARSSCKDEDKASFNKDEYNSILGTEFNLVWHALRKVNSNLSKETIEDLMSLSGTLISRPNSDGSVTLTHKNSLIKDSKLLEATLYGSEKEKLKLYECGDNNKCLDMTFKYIEITQDKSYLVLIKKIISSIARKLTEEKKGENVKLDPDEEYIVQTSSIPIINIISQEMALRGNGSTISLATEEYAELMAFDYLMSYLDSMLDEVYKALATLEYSQMDASNIKSFKEEIRYIKSYLIAERGGAFERMQTLLSVKQRFMQVQQMVKTTFAEYRSN